ncbi:MAG: iron ABC transporter [Phycisphaerales bacterium]|nr:MAG: iron ABC transporter [Phycisphaerales bacterium]
MTPLETFFTLDFPALAAGVLAAVCCALVGCFLVLRRMSLMGDAISHAVLPGLVLAFLISGSERPFTLLIAAAGVGVITTALIELVQRWGRVEPGAAMGVVFTVLFAIGVLMLERLGGRNLHIDADCLIHGQMEGALWLDAPATLAQLADPARYAGFPPQVVTLVIALALVVACIALFFKELRITSFDPALAAALGFRPTLVRYALMTLTAVVVVASFEAVGSILVIGMLVVPGMIAHLLTDRLGPMLLVSAAAALCAAVVGYYTGAHLPPLLGAPGALSAAGMIGVTLGAMLVLAALFAPRHGALSAALRRAALRIDITREDILAAMHRRAEAHPSAPHPIADLRAHAGGALTARLALRALRRRDEARADGAGGLELTPRGAVRARELVRAHRLWESYLVQTAGARADHVHNTAETLEHITDAQLARMLNQRTGHAATDPHGKPIPTQPTEADDA